MYMNAMIYYMITSCFFMVVSTQDGAEIMTDNAMYEDKFQVSQCKIACAVLHIEARSSYLMYTPGSLKGDIYV